MPRRKHGSGGRGLKDVLDHRREKEADIRFAPFVRPFGARGLSYVKRRGVDGEVLVSNAAGITFRPGAMVPVASHTGYPGEVIVGVPPPGSRGGSAAPVEIRKTVAAGGIPPHYHHLRISSTWYLYSYASGSYSLIAQIADPGKCSGKGIMWITSDPFGHVADNSVLVFSASVDSDNTACVWDPVANQAFRQPLGAGNNNYLGAPIYLSGWVYMLQMNEAAGELNLYRSRTNATTDGSTAGRALVTNDATWTPPSGFVTQMIPHYADSDAYYVLDDSGNFIKIPLDGGAVSTVGVTGFSAVDTAAFGAWDGVGGRMQVRNNSVAADNYEFKTGAFTARTGGAIGHALPPTTLGVSRNGTRIFGQSIVDSATVLAWGDWPGLLTDYATIPDDAPSFNGTSTFLPV